MSKNPEFHFLFLDVPHLTKRIDRFPKLMLYLSHDKGRKTQTNRKGLKHHEDRGDRQNRNRNLCHPPLLRTEQGQGVLLLQSARKRERKQEAIHQRPEGSQRKLYQGVGGLMPTLSFS